MLACFGAATAKSSPCRPSSMTSAIGRGTTTQAEARKVESIVLAFVTMRVGLRPIGSEWWHHQLPAWRLISLTTSQKGRHDLSRHRLRLP